MVSNRYLAKIHEVELATQTTSDRLPLQAATVVMSLFHNRRIDPEELGPEPFKVSREDAIRAREVVSAVVPDEYTAAQVAWFLVSGVALAKDPLDTWGSIVVAVCGYSEQYAQ